MKRLAILLVALACLSGAAFADTLYTLTPPSQYDLGYGAGAGGSRGDIVQMTGNYNVTSIGIDGILANGYTTDFTAYVWSSDGVSGLTQLAANTISVTGTGSAQFITIPLSYTLQSGTYYDIGIGWTNFNDPNWQVHYYNFNTNDPSFSVGPFTVLDGEESHCGPCNSYAPNLQLDGGVPEPGTFVMLGTGILGLAGTLRRKLF